LIAGHAQYVKGAVEARETIGRLTSSESWKSSGTQDKQDAVSTMQEAGKERDCASQRDRKVEAAVEKVVGCEGMEKEGRRAGNE
ncbi:uncharacterized protein BDR25DRAFT_230518, partial [Lindgomyces ingoldianus]